jgi:hypothetical protein
MIRSVATLLGRNVRKKAELRCKDKVAVLLNWKKSIAFLLFDKLILKIFKNILIYFQVMNIYTVISYIHFILKYNIN